MNCGISYEGFFLKNPLPGHLENTMKYQHITSELLPEETHNALWGTSAIAEYIGYGNDGKNEGYLVRIKTDNPDLQKILDKMQQEKETMTHTDGFPVTVSLAKDGKEEDTKALHFEDVYVMSAEEVIYGGYNENMKRPLFKRMDTEVYVEPRYSFHGTGDELFDQAVSGKFGDIAQIHRLREILYNEQKYKKASIVGFIRDGMYEREKHPDYDFNLNQAKVIIYRDGVCDTGDLSYEKGKTIRLAYKPGDQGVQITMKDIDEKITASTIYPIDTFNAKDRNSFDTELAQILEEAKQTQYEQYNMEKDEVDF